VVTCGGVGELGGGGGRGGMVFFFRRVWGGGRVKSTVLSMILMSIKGWAHQNWIRIGCYPRKIDK